MGLFRTSHAAYLEALPTNVMVCDAKTFKITYLNRCSKETLQKLAHLLPKGVTADNIVGQSIDVFHKFPEYQRDILSKPHNLPHQAIIKLGEELLDLQISQAGNGELVLSWSVATEREHLRIMVDRMPINVMLCDPKTFKITYLNHTSRETLRSIQKLMPVRAEEVLGQCIDIFHKMPEHQRKLLSDPANLPHRAKITLGSESLDLRVSALTNDKGVYLGPMLTWSVITAQVALANEVQGAAQVVSTSSIDVTAMAKQLSGASTTTKERAESVGSSSIEANSAVQMVAAAAEELSASLHEVNSRILDSTSAVSDAVRETERVNTQVEGLSEAATKVGEVVSLINDIASQTNLLALNATIEAARAGDAGKGFAVVAGEVKNLANQTARATDEISQQISTIQTETREAVAAIRGISETIAHIDDIMSSIAEAVEQQTAATNEIANNAQRAATSTEHVSHTIQSVTDITRESDDAISALMSAATSLSDRASTLNTQVSSFMKQA